jgi:hypothetical protein
MTTPDLPPDHERWMAFAQDTEHNLVGLMEERPLA